MRKFLVILCGCLALNSTLPALLPPLHQSIKELKALLSYVEYTQQLPSGDLITDIKRTEEGYLIVTNKRELRAVVTYEKTDKKGPAKFKFEFLQ